MRGVRIAAITIGWAVGCATQEYSYTVEGDTLVIDFRSVSLGEQKKRVVKLTPDVLVLQDVASEGSTEYRRVR
ncbi:MAG: hypothetical protein P8Y29_00205 [Gemmatimonadota bacterium]|jgi:hypothetical protein